MRLEHGDDHDIRQLVERGAAGWSGPSPAAGESRWAAAAGRGRRGRAARLVVGMGFAAVVLGAAAIIVAGQPASGPAASVMWLVSRVLPAASVEPTTRPAPSPLPASPTPAAAGAATATPATTARPTARPVPSPTRSDDYRRPSPSPSPRASGPPSPSPSPTDE